ncbi:choline/ethanolamine kinase-like protein, partial [Dinothrombium tinctorium]
STTPTVQDLRDPELNGAIARKLAKIHSMKMPISKVPLFLEFYAEILLSIDLAKNIDDLNPKNQEFVKRVFEFPFKEEVEWFTSIIPKIQSRVVFSHNDLYSNNILLKKRFDSIYERPLIIDYEMSGYFYRGYDIACYLKMKNFDIDRNGDQVKIIYIENEREEEDKKHFLTEYLQEWLKVSSQIDANLDNIEQLEKEAVFFSLLKDIMFIGEARLFINFFDESKLFSTNTPHIPDYFNNKRKVLQRYGLLET